ncbi:stress responsive A/B barrel domain-containing protein [Xylaria bambusicola]|uniref:stress responsive A/B barrel domain-containing protein n=1 Tax=Xylaria bambusicola TaxID=326684 RepID=UPI00200740E6|nr:stress responsive A/B barrel domain-containing protein [Xylaria bambusicola]KAI0516896.1 stress responsive A/B barrel domain-containing protein [Xylaria bambusicola]
MAIYHIVMFAFKATVSAEDIKTTCDIGLHLGEKCIHPTTKATYVKILGCGKENSIGNRQDGITHCLVAKFENEEDRKYYLESDPAHREFVLSVVNRVEKIQVVDFTPGEF